MKFLNKTIRWELVFRLSFILCMMWQLWKQTQWNSPLRLTWRRGVSIIIACWYENSGFGAATSISHGWVFIADLNLLCTKVIGNIMTSLYASQLEIEPPGRASLRGVLGRKKILDNLINKNHPASDQQTPTNNNNNSH